MASKKERTWGNARYTQEEIDFLETFLNVLGKNDSEFIRLCIALAAPQLLLNEFTQRTELKDTIKGMKEYVYLLWNEMNKKV